MAFAGATATTVVISVAGPAVVTLRLLPRPMGQPRLVRGVVGRRSRSRSYLAGTLADARAGCVEMAHVRFLGEGVAATPPPYPTCDTKSQVEV
jgi:hypothetical protein